jgi:hypothetical protein
MYIVFKTIRGRRYRYLQRSWREGKRVRTQSKSLGPVDGGECYSADYDPILQERIYNMAMASLERDNKKFDEWQRQTFGETGAEKQAREHQESKFSQDKFLEQTAEVTKTEDDQE